MDRPAVHFAKTPEGKIAYQVIGDGPVDVVYHPSGAWNLDLIWEYPPLARFLRRIASFSRLIVCNPRGWAMSDPLDFGTAGAAEDWARDLTWTLDHVGSERITYVTEGDACPMSLLWAAAFPERAHALVLSGGYATLRREDDYPYGYRAEGLDRVNAELTEIWGTGALLTLFAPELADDQHAIDWYARMERGTMSPSVFAKTRRLMSDLDLRGILPQVRCPALVIEYANDAYLRPGHGRYIADHLPAARHVERPGSHNVSWLRDADWMIEEIQASATGLRSNAYDDDRVLATVLFTDIVDSTSRAAALGDHRWKELLAEHDAAVDDELSRFGGHRVKSTGDGVLATFDGPARAIRCAFAIGRALDSLGISIRTGLHTGEIERRPNDIAGIAVHIGARVMNEAAPGEVLVSGAMPPLVAGSGIEFDDRGEHELKGVPGSWKVYAVRA